MPLSSLRMVWLSLLNTTSLQAIARVGGAIPLAQLNTPLTTSHSINPPPPPPHTTHHHTTRSHTTTQHTASHHHTPHHTPHHTSLLYTTTPHHTLHHTPHTTIHRTSRITPHHVTASPSSGVCKANARPPHRPFFWGIDTTANPASAFRHPVANPALPPRMTVPLSLLLVEVWPSVAGGRDVGYQERCAHAHPGLQLG